MQMAMDTVRVYSVDLTAEPTQTASEGRKYIGSYIDKVRKTAGGHENV